MEFFSNLYLYIHKRLGGKYIFILFAGTLIFFGIWVAPAQASISRVHYYHAFPSNTVTVATSTAGDFLVVEYDYSDVEQSPTISDTQGNTWHLAGNITTPEQNLYPATIEVWYTMNIAGGSNDVITATTESSNSITATEYSGVATTNAFDVSSTAAGPGIGVSGANVATVGPMTTNFVDGIFTAWADQQSFTAVSSWQSPFVLIHNQTVDNNSQADYVNAPVGSVNSTANDNNDSWIMFMFGFKPKIDIIPPSVAWTSPSGNPTVSSTITLTASSTDDSAVASVAFYEGPLGSPFSSSTLIGSTSTASGTLYSVSWNTTSALVGSTTLWAVSTDSSNNTSTATTTVNVQNPPTIHSFTPTPTHVGPGGSSALSWNIQNASSVSITPGSFSTSTAVGTLTVNPTSTTVYTISASSIDGTSTATTTVFVEPAPFISIVNPIASTAIAGVISVEASSTDTDGIASVQFYLNDAAVGVPITSTSSADIYSYSWNTALTADGSYSLYAVATDNYGIVTTSTPVTFTVFNPVVLNAANLIGDTSATGTPLWTQNDIWNNVGHLNGSGFNSVNSIALDPVGHRLFVMDAFPDDYRILIYPLDDTNSITTTTPENVLGAPDFTTFGTGGSDIESSTFGGNVVNLTYDSVNKRLFVSDLEHSRVLAFNVATSTIRNDEGADFVLGQPDFTSSAATDTQSGLDRPDDMAYDSVNNRLFVSDAFNSRVMVFSVPANATSGINGENAIFELGQPTFTHDAGLDILGNPTGEAYDPVNSRIFVDGNSYVSAFSVPANATTGINGEAPTFTLGGANATPTQNSLNAPDDDTYDPTGNRLFVSDRLNSRMVVFVVPSNATSGFSGANATISLNQPSWSSSISGDSQNEFDEPEPDVFDPVNQRIFFYEYLSTRVVQLNMIRITTPSLPSSTVGVAYSEPLTVTSTQGTSQTYRIFSGSLPAGLSLNTSTGVIGGTPTGNSTTTVTIEADDNFPTGPFFDLATYTMEADNPSAALLSITTTTALQYSATQGSTTPSSQQVVIGNKGGATSTLDWSASSTASWLSFGSSSGMLAANATTSISFVVDPTGLTSGTYNATATISDPAALNSPQSIGVTFTINSAGVSTPTTGSVGVAGGGSSAPSLTVVGSATTVATRSVILSLYAPSAYTMELSNTLTFASSAWIPYVTSMPWTLASSTGEQTVYVQFRSVSENIIGSAHASIDLALSASSSGATSMQEYLSSLETQLSALQAKTTERTSSYVFTRSLSFGMTGNDVKQLQEYLINQNSGSAAKKLAANGITQLFGSLTKAALIEFQMKVGISPALGYFGPITKAWINAHE